MFCIKLLKYTLKHYSSVNKAQAFSMSQKLCKKFKEETYSPDDDYQPEERDREYEQLASSYFGSKTAHSCFIIHPYVKWGKQKVRETQPQQQMEEAVALIRTLAPWIVYDTITVPLDSLEKNTLFGTGTYEKLKTRIRRDSNITAVFINMGTLKNVQLEELELAFGVPILDRYKIVMEILRLHAISKHAKLQVALAEIPYLRSRLRKFDTVAIPSGQPETRKLILQNRELSIKNAIKKLRFHRELLRNRRKRMEYPVVAIVGYTNCGKTSLIKALTGEKALQPKDQLFATLDVTVHGGLLPSSLEVLYVDTVGFIADIPTNLIECFVATLEDAMFADVIVHVEDLSSKDLLFQRKHVLSTLQGLADKTGAKELLQKVITVGNKYDIATEDAGADGITVSAKTQLGIDVLRQSIEDAIFEATGRTRMTFKIPVGGDEIRWLYKNATIIATQEDLEDNQLQRTQVVITQAKIQQFRHHFVKR